MGCRLQEALDDGTGMITREQFLHGLQNQDEVVDCLIELGLGEEGGIFDTLDPEGAGVLRAEEFYSDLLFLAKGFETMRAKDVVPSLLLVQACFKRWRAMESVYGTFKTDLARSKGSSAVDRSSLLPEAEAVHSVLQDGDSAEPMAETEMRSTMSDEIHDLMQNLNTLTEKVNGQLYSL